MKNDRLSTEESMIFTKVQIYLILGCIVAIAVLSFSLGHLVSRKSSPEEPTAEVVYGSDQVSKEAMEELNRLEERLDAVKTYSAEDGVPAVEPIDETSNEKPEPVAEVSIVKIEPVVETPIITPERRPEPVVETPVIEKVKSIPVRIKSLGGDVTKAARKPATKPVNVRKKLVKKKAPKKPSKKPQARRVSTPGVGLIEARVKKPKLPSTPAPEFKPKAKAKAKNKKAKTAKKEYISSKSKYTIQVATFPSRVEAEKVTKSLKSKGYKAYIHTLARSRSVWYRVRVGGYNSKDDAVDTIVDLREKEGFQAVIDRYQKAP